MPNLDGEPISPRTFYNLELDIAEAIQLLHNLEMMEACGFLMETERGPLDKLRALLNVNHAERVG